MKTFLQKIFGSKPEELPSSLTDYSLMAVDIHSHLIPGIDDGAPDMEASMEMIRALKEIGFKKIITSPHVVTDSYNNTTETILRGRDAVREAIARENLGLEFDAVAEYYLDDSIIPKIAAKDLLTFGKNYVLVELSYMQKANNISDLLYRLQVAGYRVVLAHPERYPYYYETDFASYHSLKDRNVLFQINIASLNGRYGKPAQYTAERMIDEGMVEFCGTDLHRISQMESLSGSLRSKNLELLFTGNKLLNKTLI